MQAFSTPKSREWSGVTAQQAVVNGNCPSIKCNYCDKVFLGGMRVQQQLAFASEIKKEAKRRERQGREAKGRQGEAREGKGRKRKAKEREGTATR